MSLSVPAPPAYSCISFLPNYYVCFGPSVIPCSSLCTAVLRLSAGGPSVSAASTCGYAATALTAGVFGSMAPLYADWHEGLTREKVRVVLESFGIFAALRKTRVQKVTRLETLYLSGRLPFLLFLQGPRIFFGSQVTGRVEGQGS